MVTLILTRIVFVLSIPLCLYAVYFGVVALFGLRKKLPAAPQAKPEKRFALVVAARNEAAVIGLLGAQPLPMDEIIDRSQLPAARALAAITLLEVKQYIRRLPGKRFTLGEKR